jgi:hypothetical protein
MFVAQVLQTVKDRAAQRLVRVLDQRSVEESIELPAALATMTGVRADVFRRAMEVGINWVPLDENMACYIGFAEHAYPADRDLNDVALWQRCYECGSVRHTNAAVAGCTECGSPQVVVTAFAGEAERWAEERVELVLGS